MKLINLKSNEMSDSFFRERQLDGLLHMAEGLVDKDSNVHTESLLNYANSLIEGNNAGAIDMSMWSAIYDKVTKYLAACTKPEAKLSKPWTPEMYEAAKDAFRVARLRGKTIHKVPLLLAYQKPVSLTPFQKRGIDAFYYGSREEYGGMYIVLPNQVISTKNLPDGCAELASLTLNDGNAKAAYRVKWVCKLGVEDALHAAVSQQGVFPVWGFPWLTS